MSDAEAPNVLIGRPMERVEDLRFLRGRGQYVSDVNKVGQLHAVILRSPMAHGHIRKYDGEPFEPKHIVSAVNDVIGGQEIVNVLSTEPGWRTDHPTGTSGPWDGLQQVIRPGMPTKA